MPKKSSPKNAKGSPKSDKKGSPKSDKKGSPKSKGSSPVKTNEQNKAVVEIKLSKHQETNDDYLQYKFVDYRCPRCYLVMDGFMKFMNHECWRPYYLGKLHFGETQAYACQTCNRIYQTQQKYDRHKCDKLTPEDVLPITYRNHFQFYLYWNRRIDNENRRYETDWKYVCRCIKCGNKFKRLILYILHTCFQYSLLKPIEVKCLKICFSCKFVFIDKAQYDMHLPYCPRKDRAYCHELMNSSFLRCCQQFVIGRHCYDFDLHIQNKPLENSDITNKPLPVGCHECDLIQPSILEYLYHPCIAGKLITPADLEITLLCNKCHCLFINYEACETHLRYCESQLLTFIRFNASEIKVALERWVTDVGHNPYLPKRPSKMRCQFCSEIFCDLKCALTHLCPKKTRYEHILIQPISLSELYICESCNLLLYTATESVNHAEDCSVNKPILIQVHPDLHESVEALKMWSKLPRLLQMEIFIGMPQYTEKCAVECDEKMIKCEDYCKVMCGNSDITSQLE